MGAYLIRATEITEERNADQKAIAILTDAIDALEQGFAHYDENFMFQLCNERYLDMLVGDSGFVPYPGMDGRDIAREMFGSGQFIMPDDVTVEEMVIQLELAASQGAQNLEFRLVDGRILDCCYNRTALGGLIVTLNDITDTKDLRACRHESIRTQGYLTLRDHQSHSKTRHKKGNGRERR